MTYHPRKPKNTVVACINAGGRNSRMTKILAGGPKALAGVGQPPLSLIEHQINWLLKQGIRQIIVNAGSRTKVADFVRQLYPTTQFPQIHTLIFEDEHGTGGDLLKCIQSKPDIFTSGTRLVVCNVDTIVDCQVGALLRHLDEKKAMFAISVTKNKNVQYEDAYLMREDDKILYSKEGQEDLDQLQKAERLCRYRATSTGVVAMMVNFFLDACAKMPDLTFSLYNDIPALAIEKGAAYAYNNGNKLYAEIGSEPNWSFYTTEQPNLIQPYLCYRSSSVTDGVEE